jgi:hypothetical protein
VTLDDGEDDEESLSRVPFPLLFPRPSVLEIWWEESLIDAEEEASAAETARVEEEAIRQAAEDAARRAAAEAEKAAQEVTLEAKRKSDRDARYAARKARQR